MSTLREVRLGAIEFAASHNLWILPSSVYELFPDRARLATIEPNRFFPDEWPNGESPGIYLFFGDNFGDPELLYVGKTASSLSGRLNDYIDRSVRRSTGLCKLRTQWKANPNPWTAEPRYLVTIALEREQDDTCPYARKLEAYLIQNYYPTQNCVA